MSGWPPRRQSPRPEHCSARAPAHGWCVCVLIFSTDLPNAGLSSDKRMDTDEQKGWDRGVGGLTQRVGQGGSPKGWDRGAHPKGGTGGWVGSPKGWDRGAHPKGGTGGWVGSPKEWKQHSRVPDINSLPTGLHWRRLTSSLLSTDILWDSKFATITSESLFHFSVTFVSCSRKKPRYLRFMHNILTFSVSSSIRALCSTHERKSPCGGRLAGNSPYITIDSFPDHFPPTP